MRCSYFAEEFGTYQNESEFLEIPVQLLFMVSIDYSTFQNMSLVFFID